MIWTRCGRGWSLRGAVSLVCIYGVLQLRGEWRGWRAPGTERLPCACNGLPPRSCYSPHDLHATPTSQPALPPAMHTQNR